MPTTVAAAEAYHCRCGAWRWVETAQHKGERKFLKCGTPFSQASVGLLPVGKKTWAPGVQAKAQAKPKTKSRAAAKPKAKAQTGPKGGGAQTPPWATSSAPGQ